jgi:hypothetical protein
MPQTTAETQQILIDEVLQKLQNMGPLSADDLLKVFLADAPELQQIKQQTLSRIRNISQATLDSIVNSLQKELFGAGSTIIKDMADPFGLVEVRETQIKETETFIKNKWNEIKSELEKTEVSLPKIEELIQSEIKISTPTTSTEPEKESPVIKETAIETNETLKELNKTLKKMQRSVSGRQVAKEPPKISFSEAALDKLRSVTGFDRKTIEELKQKIYEDPSKKITPNFKRRTGLFGKTIYETGPRTITLSSKSVKDIMDSLNISNDDQEKLLEALAIETKETNKEIKDAKKSIIESPLFKIGNAFAKVIQDLLAIATFFLGGAGLIQIAQSFGPAILDFVDKNFGTNLKAAFEGVLQPFEKFPEFFDKIKGFFVKVGLGLVTFVAGLKLTGFLLKTAILGSWRLMTRGFQSLMSSLGRGISNWFKGFKVQPPKPATTSTGTARPSSPRSQRGGRTPTARPIPTGAVRVGTGSYVLNGKAYSIKTGQPLRGAAATSVLRNAARVSPAIPTPPPSGAGVVGRQLAKGVSKVAVPLTVLLEGVDGYNKYNAFVDEVDQRIAVGEISQKEGEELKLKAKGRITGETTARTGAGLIGAALTAGAVGAGIGAAGFGVGAIPGFLIGLGAGALGYYGGQKLSDVSGLTEVAGQAGETTAVAMEEQYGKKPELKVKPEPMRPSLSVVEETSVPFIKDVEKSQDTLKIGLDKTLEMQKEYQLALMGNLDNMTRQLGVLGENFAGMGNVINSVNIGGGGSGKMNEILISGSRDPVYDTRSTWWNISRRGQMSLYGF